MGQTYIICFSTGQNFYRGKVKSQCCISHWESCRKFLTPPHVTAERSTAGLLSKGLLKDSCMGRTEQKIIPRTSTGLIQSPSCSWRIWPGWRPLAVIANPLSLLMKHLKHGMPSAGRNKVPKPCRNRWCSLHCQAIKPYQGTPMWFRKNPATQLVWLIRTPSVPSRDKVTFVASPPSSWGPQNPPKREMRGKVSDGASFSLKAWSSFYSTQLSARPATGWGPSWEKLRAPPYGTDCRDPFK